MTSPLSTVARTPTDIASPTMKDLIGAPGLLVVADPEKRSRHNGSDEVAGR